MRGLFCPRCGRRPLNQELCLLQTMLVQMFQAILGLNHLGEDLRILWVGVKARGLTRPPHVFPCSGLARHFERLGVVTEVGILE